ncbi:double-stranded RNA-binding protein 2 isoform X2 [Cornus florida]|uniref:double-stranded RNA-binding protein 2 isoform X2 n=1 Tax=Cornus florida TaxID=4283 RepID=UPI00289B0F4B|nr:double-stranded RNA-binding protein 2 isoform X2 [Cornus florida]
MSANFVQFYREESLVFQDDETGVYKNLLQEITQRVAAPLPQYTTFRSGLGHLPVFTGTVELAGITFTGEPAKNKKQAEKNAAMAAWTSLKQLAQQDANSSSETENSDELEQIRVARALLNYCLKEKMGMANSSSAPVPFQRRFPIQNPRPSSPQRPQVTASKILPLICPKTAPQSRHTSTVVNDCRMPSSQSPQQSKRPVSEGHAIWPQRFPAAGAAPYVPFQHFRTPYQGIAPPVTIRTAVPVFSAPPRPPPSMRPPQVMQSRPVQIAPPVCIRQAVPVFAAPSVRKEDPPTATTAAAPKKSPDQVEETETKIGNDLPESEAVKGLEQLKI